jgi:hypothetical protein
MARRLRVRGAALGLAAAVALVAPACSDDADEPLTAEELCTELRAIDPGRSFAGSDAVVFASAARQVADLAGQAPEEVADAMAVIASKVDENPAVRELPDLEQADEAYSEAFQATYALRFDAEINVAAGLLERYGVDECGLEASGNFDIDAIRDSDLAAADIPVLTQQELEALRVEFTPADLRGFELRPFEIPDVEFDEDLSEFQLDDPDIPRPQLGG